MTRWLFVLLVGCGVPRGGLSDFSGDGGVDDSSMDACAASAEDCNGVDDDCDGETDEGLTTRSCGLLGACIDGIETCGGGAWSACSITPGDEDCTAAGDEDCDGAVDEGCACSGGPRECGDTDVGACMLGMQTCDGERWSACMGAVGPTAETCNDIDDDCDGSTDEMVRTIYFRDADGDGFGSSAMMVQACSLPEGFVSNSTDCDDSDPTRRPGIEESCNDIDDDCDTDVDEGAGTPWYEDADGDGFGDPLSSMIACDAPAGFVDDSGDCDDDCFFCRPDMPSELCDGSDNDCDTSVDESCSCEPIEIPAGRYIACPDVAVDWFTARATCQSLMMDLAVLRTDAENAAVNAALESVMGGFTWWIGATDRDDEDEWFWVDGPPQFTDCSGGGACDCTAGDCNWDSGEPNNEMGEDCATIMFNGEWNDRDCDDPISFVCE